MSENNQDIINENASLKAQIEKLKEKNEKLEDQNDGLHDRITELEEENWNMEDEIESLKQAPLWEKFNEIFEFYNCIWSDETKDKQLLEAMKKLHWNQRNE